MGLVEISKVYAQGLAVSCEACDEFGYIMLFGVDVIVELGDWCALCEKPSIGCRILRDLFMNFVK